MGQRLRRNGVDMIKSPWEEKWWIRRACLPCNEWEWVKEHSGLGRSDKANVATCFHWITAMAGLLPAPAPPLLIDWSMVGWWETRKGHLPLPLKTNAALGWLHTSKRQSPSHHSAGTSCEPSFQYFQVSRKPQQSGNKKFLSLLIDSPNLKDGWLIRALISVVQMETGLPLKKQKKTTHS